MQEIGVFLAWQVFFLKKWDGGRGKGEGAESFLCAVSVPTEVLRLKALIKAKTFSKQVARRNGKHELHFDIPWDTYWEYSHGSFFIKQPKISIIFRKFVFSKQQL